MELVKTPLDDIDSEDALAEHLVILKNGHVHVTKTIHSLSKAGIRLVKGYVHDETATDN